MITGAPWTRSRWAPTRARSAPTGNTGTYNWTYPAGSLYFLLAGNDGAAEGSYGQDSLGTERAEDLVCAIPQDLTSTCVP